MTCEVVEDGEICGGKHEARDMCIKHYRRWKRHGDPLRVTRRKPFHDRYHRGGEDECWLWKHKPNSEGYGGMHWGGRMEGAHRIAYMLKHGRLPGKGLVVMHTCMNKTCVNPKHLEAGTHAMNASYPDRSGEGHPDAKVPDCVKNDIVRRYKETAHLPQRHTDKVTQQSLADELTALGWPTATTTVCRWVSGEARADHAGGNGATHHAAC